MRGPTEFVMLDGDGNEFGGRFPAAASGPTTVPSYIRGTATAIRAYYTDGSTTDWPFPDYPVFESRATVALKSSALTVTRI